MHGDSLAGFLSSHAQLELAVAGEVVSDTTLRCCHDCVSGDPLLYDAKVNHRKARLSVSSTNPTQSPNVLNQ